MSLASLACIRFQSTLLMRGATQQAEQDESTEDISIHAPHARSDGTAQELWTAASDFNPRSSCEERRWRGRTTRAPTSNFNPRSSCEERRPSNRLASCRHSQFQSTLLMRGATHPTCCRSSSPTFQSTLLMRGATCRVIHVTHLSSYFNPRSSCEERLVSSSASSRIP